MPFKTDQINDIPLIMTKRKFIYPVLLLLLLILIQCSLNASDYRKITYDRIRLEGKIWGIDLSHHQSTIDWDLLEEQKPYFIFFKATEGTTITDRYYRDNYRNARRLGILVGSYHFFSYRSSGRDQANHFLSVCKRQKGDMPLVLDVEFLPNMPPRKIVTNEIIAFLKTVYQRTGKKPIIYCNDYYFRDYIEGNLKNEHLIWICDYNKKPQYEWTFWQTTDKFRLNAVKGNVDFNLFNGSLKDLNKLLF